MLDLTAIPSWSLPAVIVFIFSLGAWFQRLQSSGVTPATLKACQDAQRAKLDAITAERAGIWDCVRKTEQQTAVIVNDLAWVQRSLDEIKKSMEEA